jgi:hypothetical protein
MKIKSLIILLLLCFGFFEMFSMKREVTRAQMMKNLRRVRKAPGHQKPKMQACNVVPVPLEEEKESLFRPGLKIIPETAPGWLNRLEQREHQEKRAKEEELERLSNVLEDLLNPFPTQTVPQNPNLIDELKELKNSLNHLSQALLP